MLLDCHNHDLQYVEANQYTNWKGIRLQKVEVVVKAAGVQRRKDVVATLGETETKSVVEAPVRVCDQVGEYLRHP